MSLSGISGLSGLSAIIASADAGPDGDPDANAFIAAAGLTDETEITAVRDLVSTLKIETLWGLLEVIYPFVGGNATAHSFNLRNVAQFQITWNGTINHDSSGVQGDAGTGWGETGIIPNSMNRSSWSHGIYNRQDTSFSAQAGFGCTENLSEEESTHVNCYPNASGETNGDCPGITFVSNLRAGASSALGLTSISREADDFAALYRNGMQIASNASNEFPWPSVSMALLGNKFGGVFGDGVNNFSFNQLAFAFKGVGLTGAQMATLYSTIQTFNGTLARQV